MLVTVVHDDDFGVHFFHRITAGHVTVFADDYRYAGHHLGHQVGFVAGLIAGHVDLFAVGYHAQGFIPVGPVTAVQDDHPVSHVFDHHGYTLGSRRFAGTAYGNVTDGDNAAVQLPPGQDAYFVEPQVYPGAEAVNIGQPPQ